MTTALKLVIIAVLMWRALSAKGHTEVLRHGLIFVAVAVLFT